MCCGVFNDVAARGGDGGRVGGGCRGGGAHVWMASTYRPEVDVGCLDYLPHVLKQGLSLNLQLKD